MTRAPREVSGKELRRALQKLGYESVRQESTHVTVETQQNGTHRVTVPEHNPMKFRTLQGILRDVANHFKMKKEELIDLLFR